MHTTIATIKSIVAKLKLKLELTTELGDSTDLINEVGFDSLQMLQFMLDIEERLGIQIDFNELEFAYLEDIQVLAAFLERMPRRQQATGPS